VPRFLLVVQSAVYGQGVLLATGRLFAVETAVKIDKERAELLKLIDDAQALASIGKTSDAVTKLRNFTVKVDQPGAACRTSAESADPLRSDAQATIACLEGSTTSTAVGAKIQ
jgi:hypothetical protein